MKNLYSVKLRNVIYGGERENWMLEKCEGTIVGIR